MEAQSSNNAFPSYLFAALIGFTIGYISLGWPMIRGDVNPANLDQLTHITGANYFLQDGWHWPLFYVDDLHYPEGTNIIFTDSIPWVAGLLKLLQPFGLGVFNYFGWWLLFCFIAQGLSMAVLLRSGGVRSFVALFTGVALACLLPALHFRFGHAALCAHFLLILALAHYLHSLSGPSFRRVLVLGAVLSWWALITHAYLWAMVTPIVGLTYLLGAVEHRWTWKQLTIGVSCWVGGTIVVLVVAGYMGRGSGASGSGGFGYYSMNMLSPLIPQFSGIFPYTGPYEAHPGQYEGMNYLGLGVGVLVLAATIGRPHAAWRSLRRHAFLAVILALLMVYAWSNSVYFGPWKLIDYSLGPFEDLASQFRSSGRFFWPCAYALIAWGTITSVRWFPRRVGIAVLASAALLQFADVSPSLSPKMLPAWSEQDQAKFERWDVLIGAHERIALFPDIATRPGDERIPSIHFVWRASYQNKPISSAFIPRWNRSPEQDRAMMESFQAESGTLLICASPDYERIAASLPVPAGFSWRLTSLGPALSDRWQEIPGHHWPSVLPGPKFRSNYSFAENGEAAALIVKGFSGADSVGRWAADNEAQLHFPLPPEGKLIQVRLSLAPFLHEKHPRQRLEIILNEVLIYSGTFEWPHDAKPHELTIPIPDDLLSTTTRMAELTMRYGPTVSPQELGLHPDPRALAFFVTSLELMVQP